MAGTNGDKAARRRRLVAVAVCDDVGGDFGRRHKERGGTDGRRGENRMCRATELGRQGGPGAVPIGAMSVVAMYAGCLARLDEGADADPFLVDDDWQVIEAEVGRSRKGAARGLTKAQHHRQVGVGGRCCPDARMGQDRFDDSREVPGTSIVDQRHLVLVPAAYR